jgi:tetratricopeptide (TPR) repeat protein
MGGRGASYNNKGEYDRAIADLNDAIRLDPNLAFAYTNRGFSYNNKDECDRAIADLSNAIRLDPNSAAAYNNRGHQLQQEARLRPRNTRLRPGHPP